MLGLLRDAKKMGSRVASVVYASETYMEQHCKLPTACIFIAAQRQKFKEQLEACNFNPDFETSQALAAHT